MKSGVVRLLLLKGRENRERERNVEGGRIRKESVEKLYAIVPGTYTKLHK